MTLETARALVATALDLPPEHVAADAGMLTLDAWDSLAHLRIVLALEQHIGRALEGEEITRIEGVADVAALLDGA